MSNTSIFSIQNVINYWIGHNNTTSTPAVYSVPNINTSDGCTATRYTYGGGNNNTEVIHYKVTGGEHTWPNSAISIGVTNKDFDASKVIWAFFNKHQKVNTVSVKENVKPDLISLINDWNNNLLILESNVPNANLEYAIYDVSGKKVGGNRLTNSTSKVDTQVFNSGLYVIRVSEIGTLEVSSYKFVVN